MTTYTTIQHPVSGEIYAVEMSSRGMILRVAGPLHYSDPTDPASLGAWIMHEDVEDAEADARWLTDELRR